MNKKKIIMILILVFVLILGGAGILYKQLGQKLAPDLLGHSSTAENRIHRSLSSNNTRG